MRRVKVIAIWCIAVLGVCLAGTLTGREIVLARLSRDATPKPLVIETKSTTFVGSDLQDPVDQYYFFNAVRSDGSHSYGTIAPQPDGSWRVLFRRVKLVSDREDLILADILRLKSTIVLSKNGVTKLLSPWQEGHKCNMSGYKYVGDGTVSGFRVMKFDLSYSTGHWQEWVAPDLACHSLWGEMQLKNPDGSLRVTTYHTTVSVQEGEPSAKLFAVSGDYSEVAPSEIVKEGANLQGAVPQPALPDAAQQSLDNKLARLDQYYASHKAN